MLYGQRHLFLNNLPLKVYFLGIQICDCEILIRLKIKIGAHVCNTSIRYSFLQDISNIIFGEQNNISICHAHKHSFVKNKTLRSHCNFIKLVSRYLDKNGLKFRFDSWIQICKILISEYALSNQKTVVQLAIKQINWTTKY